MRSTEEENKQKLIWNCVFCSMVMDALTPQLRDGIGNIMNLVPGVYVVYGPHSSGKTRFIETLNSEFRKEYDGIRMGWVTMNSYAMLHWYDNVNSHMYNRPCYVIKVSSINSFYTKAFMKFVLGNVMIIINSLEKLEIPGIPVTNLEAEQLPQSLPKQIAVIEENLPLTLHDLCIIELKKNRIEVDKLELCSDLKEDYESSETLRKWCRYTYPKDMYLKRECHNKIIRAKTIIF